MIKSKRHVLQPATYNHPHRHLNSSFPSLTTTIAKRTQHERLSFTNLHSRTTVSQGYSLALQLIFLLMFLATLYTTCLLKSISVQRMSFVFVGVYEFARQIVPKPVAGICDRWPAHPKSDHPTSRKHVSTQSTTETLSNTHFEKCHESRLVGCSHLYRPSP